jgi:hypothetical protein
MVPQGTMPFETTTRHLGARGRLLPARVYPTTFNSVGGNMTQVHIVTSAESGVYLRLPFFPRLLSH